MRVLGLDFEVFIILLRFCVDGCVGGLAVDHMRFMHHVINCSWLITAHAQCALTSIYMGQEAAAAATCLRSSSKLKDMQLWLLMY